MNTLQHVQGWGKSHNQHLKNSAVPWMTIGPQSAKLPQSETKTHPPEFTRVAIISQSVKFPQPAVQHDVSVSRVEIQQRVSFSPLLTTIINVQLTTAPLQTAASLPHLIPMDIDIPLSVPFKSHVLLSKEGTYCI